MTESIKHNLIYLEQNTSRRLPEHTAYIKYSDCFGVNFVPYHPNDCIPKRSVIWKFMGIDLSNDFQAIHDYRSLSTAPFAGLKDFLKRYTCKTPLLRVFLNEHTKNAMSFNDGVPYAILDMGVDDSFLLPSNRTAVKKYKYVYHGDMSSRRKFDIFLDQLLDNDKSDYKILLVGKPPNNLFNKHKNNSKIIFSGQVNYTEVPELISQAHFGLNSVPNIYPFSFQTSTKFLEYLAVGVIPLSIETHYIKTFESNYNIKVPKFKSYREIDYTKLCVNNFKELADRNWHELSWESVIRKSGLSKTISGILN